jgi:transposase InsO family protein
VIQDLAQQYPVRALCLALQVQRSGYYQWLGRVQGPRERANQLLLRSIRQAHLQSRATYGSPRITWELKRQDIACSRNRVARLMRRHGIRAKQKRPFRPRTTDSRHGERAAPNRLKQLSAPLRPNQAWVADITYVWTVAGWVYLAAVMDLCTRQIVGWALSPSLETSLVKEALKQALVVRRPAPGLLHHSDRGIQYASSAFQALLHSRKIVPSMSARGNCYDNAAMESFWSTLKSELLHHQSFQDLAQVRLALFEYIETFYNRRRLHSALGYQSPVEFEQHLNYKKN